MTPLCLVSFGKTLAFLILCEFAGKDQVSMCFLCSSSRVFLSFLTVEVTSRFFMEFKTDSG